MQPTLADKNNNPGNIRDTTTGKFKVFNSPQEGYAALLNDLETKKTGKSTTGLKAEHTLADFAKTYAPPSENDSAQYTANLANHMGVSPDTQIKDLDTGAWAEAIAKAEGYTPAKNLPDRPQGDYNPKPFSNPSGAGLVDYSGITPQTQKPVEADTLGSELKGRGQDIATAAKEAISGKINPVSGLLQGVGAVAGGIGDIVGKGLELIPGVKQLEGLLGQGVGKLAQTEAGQSVMKSIKEFSNKHPELSKDIGAGFNIVTAIPILKGLSVAGSLVKDASSQALKGVAEKAFTKGASEMIAGTKTGTRLLQKNPNVVKNMIDRRLVGDIKGGKYITQDAVNQSWKTITDSNKEIKNILRKTNANKYTIGTEDADTILGNTLKEFPNANFTSEQIAKVGKNLTPQNGRLWDKFFKGNATLEDINTLRSDLDTAVKSTYSSIAQPPIKKEIGKNLAQSMRTFVKEQAPETEALFNEMSTQFDIQKALSFMEGKSIKPGGGSKFAGHLIGTGTGATVGGMIGGVPGAIAGGMVGEKVAGGITKKIAGQNITQGVLKRTGTNAIKTPLKKSVKRVGGLLGGVVAQKTNRGTSEQ